jgi:hypothetical protein
VKRIGLLSIIALCAVAVVLALTACGGGSGDSPSGGAAGMGDPSETMAPLADENLEDLEFTRASFRWDSNDDGTLETVLVNYYKNGDEAPDAIGLTMGRSNDEGIIDSAYEIERVQEGSDEEGPFLVIDYLSGDQNSHDTTARSLVRLVNGEFETEAID